ncbi:MAG: hypothetical protein V4613_07125 [Bacteroidota bacterium]
MIQKKRYAYSQKFGTNNYAIIHFPHLHSVSEHLGAASGHFETLRGHFDE